MSASFGRGMRCGALPRRARPGFTLIELLVAIGIIVALAALALPALNAVRDMSRRSGCLANLRSLQQAHWAYMHDHRGRFIDVGLAHGAALDETVAWIETLRPYYQHERVVRSPLDDSPHWPREEGGDGVPLEGTLDAFRCTSYGCNNYLTRFSPAPDLTTGSQRAARRLSQVKSPVRTVHFLIMAFTGSYAGADHVHVESWAIDPPVRAASQMQTHAASGPPASAASVSHYGFLDGHVEALPFSAVYTNRDVNRFDPEVAARPLAGAVNTSQ